MDIIFAQRNTDRSPIHPMSASVHRRGKHLYLHVRLAREAADDMGVGSSTFAGVGFSSDGRTLALRWGVEKDQGWAFSRRKDGSASCSVKIDQFDVELTQKFHFAGRFTKLDSNTVALSLNADTRQVQND